MCFILKLQKADLHVKLRNKIHILREINNILAFYKAVRPNLYGVHIFVLILCESH